MRRNLLFHLYPIRGSFWEWHVEQLRRRWAAFNGRKIVVIAADRRTVSPETAAARFEGLDAELIEAVNDPRRGETAAFLPCLELLRSLDPRELTFYAHAKGVSHRGLKSLIMQSWSEAMYALNLSRPALIDAIMEEYSSVGCFQQQVRHAGSRWHYSGTFFWLKHSALFSRDWRRIHDGKYGVEGYVGRHIPLEEAFCLTPYRHFARLYDRVVTRAECRRWLRALQAPRRAEAASA